MDKHTKMQIGSRIRRRREANGYTREQLGELCALSPRFLANVELGDATVSLDSLLRLCHVLCCSSDDILFGEGAVKDPWAPVVARMRQMDPQYAPQIHKLLAVATELCASKRTGDI